MSISSFWIKIPNLPSFFSLKSSFSSFKSKTSHFSTRKTPIWASKPTFSPQKTRKPGKCSFFCKNNQLFLPKDRFSSNSTPKTRKVAINLRFDAKVQLFASIGGNFVNFWNSFSKKRKLSQILFLRLWELQFQFLIKNWI